MSDVRRSARIAAGLCLLASFTGCTSALSTTYLRDAWWDPAEHAAEADPPGDTPPPDTADGSAQSEPATAWAQADAGVEVADADDPERRSAAIEEAVARLSRLGPLDDATRTTLVTTLQTAPPEDWPVLVEAFADGLAVTGGPPRPEPGAADAGAMSTAQTVPPAAGGATHTVAKAALDTAAASIAPTPPAEPAESPEPADPSPTAPPDQGADGPRPLTVQNACFASRVQGWGLVDRYDADRFRPGQEVIVYFELDNLSAGVSPAGHTTCIDATLRLVSVEGEELHAWSFEPIAETCRARRRDYFARYLIRIPESIPGGGCRLEVSVGDTLAGTTATSSVPLEIVPASAAAD